MSIPLHLSYIYATYMPHVDIKPVTQLTNSRSLYLIPKYNIYLWTCSLCAFGQSDGKLSRILSLLLTLTDWLNSTAIKSLGARTESPPLLHRLMCTQFHILPPLSPPIQVAAGAGKTNPVTIYWSHSSHRPTRPYTSSLFLDKPTDPLLQVVSAQFTTAINKLLHWFLSRS